MSDLSSALESLRTLDLHGMPEATLLQHTEELCEARDALDGALAQALAVLDTRQITTTECGRTTTNWLVAEQRFSVVEARRRMAAARALASQPTVSSAVVTGEISHDHARVIGSCLRSLPIDDRADAETILVDAARSIDPAGLAPVIEALRIATGVDDDREAAAQRRYDSRWATITTTYQGMSSLQAMLDPESAQTLVTAINALMARTSEDDRTAEQRRADALVDLARHSLACGGLPDNGGLRPQLVVTTRYDDLLGRLAQLRGSDPGNPLRLRDDDSERIHGAGTALAERVAARLDVPQPRLGTDTLGGAPITPAAARRLACDAEILPAVLGSDQTVLDLGRSTRMWSTPQRRAARLRDKGCVFPDCNTGLDRCDLHHLTYWSHGGPTDLENSAHLCHFHHWLVHHTTWTIARDRHGGIGIRRE